MKCAKSFPDFDGLTSSTPSKLSHHCTCGELWANAADYFLISNWSFKIGTIKACDIRMAFTISRASNLDRPTSHHCHFMFSNMATSIWRPEDSVSLVLVLFQRNSVSDIFTIEIDGAEFSQYLLSFYLAWKMFSPQKLMLEGHTIFFLFFHFR